MSSQGKMASRVSPRKATPPKQMSKQHTKGGAAGGARKPAAAAGAGGRARARAASAAESSDEDDGGMPEGVLFEVKRLCGKRIKHGELQYQVEWLGWPNKTWEPLGNLGTCQVLVDRFEETLAESERKKEEAAAAPPAAAAAGRTPRVKHKREEKVAEPEVAEVMPRSKRARKAVEKFEPIDFDTERALRQEEQLEQLMSGTKRARKQPAAAGEGKAAAAGEEEEEEEEDAEDEYEITRIIGKKKEKGVTLYLCEWAPIGEQTFEPTFEPEENINAKNLIAEFEERSKRGKRTKRSPAPAPAPAAAEAPPSAAAAAAAAASPSHPPASPLEAMSESVGIINEDDEEEEEEEEEEDVVMVVSTTTVVHESSTGAAAAAIPAATVAAAAPDDFTDADASNPAELRPLPLDPRPAQAPAENLQEPTVSVSMLLPPPGSDAEPMLVVGVIDEGEEEGEEEAEKEEEQPAKEELAAESLDSVVAESQLRPSFELSGAAPAAALFGEDERQSAQAPPPAQAEPAFGEISSSPPMTQASAADASAKEPSASESSPPPPRSGGGGIASKISHWVHSALGVPEEDDEAQMRAARKQEHKSQKREG